MVADGGNAARGGHLTAVGEHLSASARPDHGAGRVQDGALCRRLRDLVSRGGRSRGSAAPGDGVDDGQRIDAAPRQDTHGRRAGAGPGIRVPGLSVRGRASIRAQEEPASVQAQSARQDGTHSGRQSGSDHRRPQPHASGWFAYFRAATPFTFSTLDSFIRRQLRSILRKQAKRPGRGRTFEDHRRWPNVFFADRGLFALNAAHESARDSR